MALLYKELTTTLKDFALYVNNTKSRNIRLFYDIETLKYNTNAVHKTEIKSRMYSFAIGYIDDDKENTVRVIAFPNFFHFNEWFKGVFKHKARKTIELVAHNNNKFDNHFLIQEMQLFYNAKTKNAYIRNALDHRLQEKQQDVKKSGENVILETRVRSMTNVEFDAFLNGIHYKTIDNFPKTGSSLRNLGEQLATQGFISLEQQKTNLAYDQFDVIDDMDDETATIVCENAFQSLSDDDFIYILNDIIVLAKAVLHYSSLYYGFDWSKMTKTQNIKEKYLVNELTRFQLLKTIGEGKTAQHLPYADYKLDEETNLFDYFNLFYKGGLNFYNPSYIDRIIEEECFSIDINSSYPFCMYAFKVPTFVESFDFYKKERPIFLELDDPSFWFMYEVNKTTFNNEVLLKLKSKIAKKMIRKYYFVTGESIYVNTNTFKMLRDNFNLNIETIPVLSSIKWRCYDFGAKEQIFEFYKIKTQGKFDKVLNFVDNSPLDIRITEEEYTGEHYTEEQQAIAKVNLNGLYGLPALRAFFNLGTRLENGEIALIPNGFKNKERNVAFSAFVTSQALYNLTEPFRYMTPEEIDDAFVYCDTDSLYLKKKVFNNIPSSLYHKMNLGKWDIENESISKILVLNHKKYAYQLPNGKIKLRCGGVKKENFELEKYTSLEEFRAEKFHNGATVKATRSIMNTINTITIYDADMTLEAGKQYPSYFTPSQDETYMRIIKELQQESAREEIYNSTERILYVETTLGAISEKDIYPKKQNNLNAMPFQYFVKNSEVFNTILKNMQEI